MSDDLRDDGRPGTDSKGSTIEEDPIDQMLHGVASQTAGMMTMRELLINKGVVSQVEWDECFAKNHRTETERIRTVMSNQRVT